MPSSAIEQIDPVRPPGLWADIFDGLPSGILVADAAKRMLAANQVARELLGDEIRRASVALCCELFGCGKPGTALESSCLTEAAIAGGQLLPEIRVDLPAGSPVGALWVTASPLGSDSSYVVFQLRRGERGDRRRRMDPHWLGERRLRITVLGNTMVESAEGPIGGSWLDQRPGQLLKYLISERERTMSAERIAAAMWPASGPEALNTVRHYIHILRQKLEPGRTKRSESSFIVGTPNGYFIDRLRVDIDADLFEQRVRTGIAAHLAGEEATGARSLQEAIDLYDGDFLCEEPYAEWALAERDRLRALAGRACRTLIEYADHTDDMETAAQYAERLAELEPFDVQVHRAVLVIALRRGRRSDAVRRYDTLRQRMMREFGEELPFELADIGRDAGAPIRVT